MARILLLTNTSGASAEVLPSLGLLQHQVRVLPAEASVLVDARGPRFGAVLTTLVLAIALVTHSSVLIALQLIVFAIGAFISPTKSPYSFIYKKFVKPRLSGEVPTEDVRPPQFAQLVGFLFAATALAGSIFGSSALFTVAVSFCLAASFLNAAFNFCLGCQVYLLGVRFTRRARN